MTTTATNYAEQARRALDSLLGDLTAGEALEAALRSGEDPTPVLKWHMNRGDKEFGFTVPDAMMCPGCGTIRWTCDFNEDGECGACVRADMQRRAEEEEACGLL